MTAYLRVPFFEAVRDATGGNPKVQRKEYLSEGPLPVVDQGQELIAGYTTTDNVYTGQLPVILFGDHTRILKYVDFPFALGADGVKVLVPQDGFEAYYLYHSFRNARIPSAGYSRHFKFLREISVCKPPLDEQRRIVGILNRAVKIERLRAQAQERLREFIPALFVGMFGDPIENPMGWHKENLGSLGSLDRGRSRHRPRNAPELYGGPYPFVQTGDIAKSHGIVKEYSQNYSESGLAQSKMWPSGTLCVTIAANIGMTATLNFDACFPDSVVGFLAGDDVAVPYIQTAIDLMQKRIEEDAPKAAQRNINLKVLRELRIPVPPLEMQNQYAQLVESARSTVAIAESGTRTASELSASLMSRLLVGCA